jgi:isopenicillin N synthase-like dioxygenase
MHPPQEASRSYAVNAVICVKWPPAYPSLRPIVEAYISGLTLLGERFLRLVAESLGLPPDTFFPFLSDQHRLKLVRYPPTHIPAQGVGPHKDSSGWWTFLLQASPHVGGLQVLNRAGAWVDVPPRPDTLVVNIGQAFEVVTAGVCRATTHRVVLGKGTKEERFSVPFFQGVRRDLTKPEAVGLLGDYFRGMRKEEMGNDGGLDVDSPFLKGRYGTWGESQLRTKIRSHPDVGRRFYANVFDRYVNDDN